MTLGSLNLLSYNKEKLYIDFFLEPYYQTVGEKKTNNKKTGVVGL